MKRLNSIEFLDLDNKLKKINFDDLKKGDTFLYLGNIYGNFPIVVHYNDDGNYSVVYGLKPLQVFYHYTLKFIKESDDIVMEVNTKERFKVGAEQKEIDYHNPIKLLNSVPDIADIGLYINRENIAEANSFSARLMYKKNGCNAKHGEVDSLARDFYNARDEAKDLYSEYISSLLSTIYPSKEVQAFYSPANNLSFFSQANNLSFFSKQPEIGEYFGYVGDIFSLVPSVSSEKIFEVRNIENQYPLLLKRISETEAIEATTEVKFQIAPNRFDVSKDAYKDLPLALYEKAYIEVNDDFKRMYADTCEKAYRLSEFLRKQERLSKESYAEALRTLDLERFPSVEEVYDIAKVENIMFDLDKKMKGNGENTLSKRL